MRPLRVGWVQEDSALIRENNLREEGQEGGAETGVIQPQAEQHQGWAAAAEAAPGRETLPEP